MKKGIPEGYHTVTPSITFKDSRKAIEFYKKAFGAQERHIMPGPDGKVMHAEIKIGDSFIMMCDEIPKCQNKSAETLGITPIFFYVYTEDADAAFQKAVAAGAESLMPPQDMFWGDRMGTVKDPFGYSWSFATKQKDLTMEEMTKASELAFKERY